MHPANVLFLGVLRNRISLIFFFFLKQAGTGDRRTAVLSQILGCHVIYRSRFVDCLNFIARGWNTTHSRPLRFEKYMYFTLGKEDPREALQITLSWRRP